MLGTIIGIEEDRVLLKLNVNLNEMDNIINLYRKNEPLDENVKITKENEKVTITLTKNIKLNTPILNKILSNKIETKRVIYDE